jgi:hypothetical protein
MPGTRLWGLRRRQLADRASRLFVLIGQGPVVLGVASLVVALVEVGDYLIRVLVDDRTVLEEQRGDLVASGLAPQFFSIGPLRGHRAGDE